MARYNGGRRMRSQEHRSEIKVQAIPVRGVPGEAMQELPLATVIDLGAHRSAALNAEVSWGDGSPNSAGRVECVDEKKRIFAVHGSHTWENPGRYAVTVSVGHGDGSRATGRCVAVIGNSEQRLLGAFYEKVIGKPAPVELLKTARMQHLAEQLADRPEIQKHSARIVARAHPNPAPDDRGAALLKGLKNILNELYGVLFPILDTDWVNNVDNPLAPFDTSYPYWSYKHVGGVAFGTDPATDCEWAPILEWRGPGSGLVQTHFETENANETMTGLSGEVFIRKATRDDPTHEISGADVPFTHPFGNDYVFHVRPDDRYLPLQAITNSTLFEVAPWMTVDPEYKDAMLLSEAAGPDPGSHHSVIGIELDEGLVPEHYRVETGDRVAVFGRWIIDAGHPDFHTEIHPPFLLVGARQPLLGIDPHHKTRDPDRTESTLIARPFITSQVWDNTQPEHPQGGLPVGLVGRVTKLFTAQVQDFILSTRGHKPAPQQIDLTPTILPGFPLFPAIVTLHYTLRPPTPRRSSGDQLRVTYHFTTRPGATAWVLRSQHPDEVLVVVQVDSLDPNPENRPTASSAPAGATTFTVFPDDPGLPENVRQALDDKVTEVTQTHGGDVGAFLQSIIDLGATTITYDPSLWPAASSSLDGLNIVDTAVSELAGREAASLPGAAAQHSPADGPFPIYGFVNVYWKRG
jgi:hypothetical protein